MKKILYVLTILMCVAIYSGVLISSPTKPDYGPVHNAWTHYQTWGDTIDESARNVETALNDAMDIANEYRSASATFRNTLFNGLTTSVKNIMATALVSALGLSINSARQIAETLTLGEAALLAFDYHETKLNDFKDDWDGFGWATNENVMAWIHEEISQNGVPGNQAHSLMEAFYRYEYALYVYTE